MRVLIVFVFVWLLTWHGNDYGPFASLQQCQETNRIYFNSSGYCRFEL
jgi:hypothetical protein